MRGACMHTVNLENLKMGIKDQVAIYVTHQNEKTRTELRTGVGSETEEYSIRTCDARQTLNVDVKKTAEYLNLGLG